MSSMKANIERAAELLDVPVDALTEYLLGRDPEDAAEEEQRERVVTASQLVGVERTLLLLGVVDIVRNADELGPRPPVPTPEEVSRRTEANRTGIAVNALHRVRRALTWQEAPATTADRLAEINNILNKAGY